METEAEKKTEVFQNRNRKCLFSENRNFDFWKTETENSKFKTGPPSLMPATPSSPVSEDQEKDRNSSFYQRIDNFDYWVNYIWSKN